MVGIDAEKVHMSGVVDAIQETEKHLAPPAGVPVPDALVGLPLDHSSSSSTDAQGKDDSDADVFAHLPADEAAILRDQVHLPKVKVNYFTLYRYATKGDVAILVVSTILSIIAGALLPLMTVVFGALAGTFQGYFLGTNLQAEFQRELAHLSLYFLYLMIGMFVVVLVSTAGFMYTGERIAAKTRAALLAATLRQNIGFFDKLGAGEITTRITSDTNLIQDGISEKVPLTIQALSTFFSAFIVAFVRSWKLTLILCSTLVAIVLVMSFIASFIAKWEKASLDRYAVGGSLVEEVVSSIRNATAFNAQDKLAEQYGVHTAAASITSRNSKFAQGVLIGLLFFLIFANYSLAFWQGSRYIVAGQMDLPQLLTIQMAVILGAMALGTVAPTAKAMTTGVAAASKIFAIIERESPLDPETDQGATLHEIRGEIELRNLRHIYPSRPEVVVMENVSLFVPAGKTTALVGASGSGKSTIVGLVERFYKPVQGEVLFDGHDVSTLNLRWLRRQMALVSQEPILFSTTVFENITHGLIGSSSEDMPKDKIKAMVEEAAKIANAHDFVSKLPQGYETLVGERGFLLSGGQKQRVAIARAIVSNPKLLLLDEATSALDTQNEGVVQAALDKAAQGRTTIVIAHRLSTIKNADNIVVMSHGRIVEQGKHHELLAKNGPYRDLVEAQKFGEESEAEQVYEEGMDSHEKHESLVRTESASRPPSSLKHIRSMASTTSISAKVLKDKPLETKTPVYPLKTLILLVLGFNKKEWYWMILGLVGCVICGACTALEALFFGKSIQAITKPPSEYAELRRQANFWSAMYLLLALLNGGAFMVHGVAFGLCSSRLIHRARNAAFRSILRQDMVFFDQSKNSPGAIASFLSTETEKLASISGATLGTILISVTTLVSGCTLGLAIGWKLSLVCMSVMPLMLLAGFLRYWILARIEEQSKHTYASSAAYACEAASAARTVASLTRESEICQHYAKSVESTRLKSVTAQIRSSAAFAFSQSLTFGVTGLAFWYGGTLIGNGEYSIEQFFLCYVAIIFGGQSAGMIFAFAGDMGKAKSSAASMKELLDRQPEIDIWSTEGVTMPDVGGHIEFRDIHFRYPTRPEVPVLRGLDIEVKPGQYVALVGPSGCGKSTTIAMLERFYNPTSGQILVDSVPISDVAIKSYRNSIALVSQEPTLYQGTIRQNILLGAPDESLVTEEQIATACKRANIHDFIVSLPQGLETTVGSKGSLLSGGQKQRVAIARALLGDPKILLLDEATSALDSESEKVVQRALDSAAKGRTTVAVAHRLSTIQRADVIYVFDQGRVVEKGSHEELMRKRGGRYAELVRLQNLG